MSAYIADNVSNAIGDHILGFVEEELLQVLRGPRGSRGTKGMKVPMGTKAPKRLRISSKLKIN